MYNNGNWLLVTNNESTKTSVVKRLLISHEDPQYLKFYARLQGEIQAFWGISVKEEIVERVSGNIDQAKGTTFFLDNSNSFPTPLTPIEAYTAVTGKEISGMKTWQLHL